MSAEAFKKMGDACYGQKVWERAIECYTKAIQLDPRFVEAYNNRGASNYNLQRYEAAIDDYDRIIELDPKDALAYNNRGIAKNKLQQYVAAIADFDIAIQLDQRYTEAYYNRGLTKEQIHQYQAAVDDFGKVIQLAPQYAMAYRDRGNAKNDLQQYQAAIVDFDKAIQLDPKDSKAYYNRGNSRYRLQQYKKAIIDYDMAIQLNPKHTNAYYHRGISKSYLEQYESAIADFDMATQLAPKDAYPWQGKGLVYYFQKNPAWAKVCFSRGAYLGLPSYRNLFLFFDDYPTAPFLTMRLIQEQVSPEDFGKIANLIHTTFRQCHSLYTFITHQSLHREKNYTTANWKKWLGIINYYMGDPIVAHQLLSGLVREGSQDLMIYYFLILSCYDFAEDEEPFIAKAFDIAQKIKGRQDQNILTEEQLLDYYYAGHIFILDEEPEDALCCFSTIQKNFLPACYMTMLLSQEQEDYAKRDELVSIIIEKEEKLGEKGYAHGLQEHFLDLNKDKLHQPFAYYFHYFEISAAIDLLADMIPANAPFKVKRASQQKAFYDLFKVHPKDLEVTRLKADVAPVLEAWEHQLKSSKEKSAFIGLEATQLQLAQKKLGVRETFFNLQEAAANGELELVFGLHIQDFKLKVNDYKELLDYFYLNGHFTEYQKLMLHFYILDQGFRQQQPSKFHIAGMKDGVKKAISEGLSILTGIVIGNIIPGLSTLAAVAIGAASAFGASYAKGALAELFITFYKTTYDKPRTYAAFKAAFEVFIAKEKERLGSSFENRYPIDELK